MSADNLFLRKHLTKLTVDELARVRELSQLDATGLNETAIREQFLAPLIRILGYRAVGDYQVLYEDTFKAAYQYVMYGRQKIKLDYRFLVWKQGLWLLEAKPGPTSTNDGLKPEDAQQAYSYSSHPKIDAPLFAVSNGAILDVYDRDSEGLDPILTVSFKNLPNQINELRELLAADQVQFYLKRKLLSRIKQVLSSELVLSRPIEFANAVRHIAFEVQPDVRRNFHANIATSPSITDIWDQLVSGSRPDDIIDNFFLRQMSGGLLQRLCERVSDQRPKFGNNLFFAHLLVEELRPVTIHYHHNVLYLLGTLARKDVWSGYAPEELRSDGKSSFHSRDLFVWWLEQLVTGFKVWPELRTLWLVDGAMGRIAKRLIILPASQRREIIQQTTVARYLVPERDLDRRGVYPATFLIEAIGQAVTSAVSVFVAEFYQAERRQFSRELARQEYARLLAFESHLEQQSIDYQTLLKELGSDWSELTGYDWINKSYDFLASGALNIAREFPDLCSNLPQSILDAAAELASVNHAPPGEFCREQGIEVIMRSAEQIQEILTRRFSL